VGRYVAADFPITAFFALTSIPRPYLAIYTLEIRKARQIEKHYLQKLTILIGCLMIMQTCSLLVIGYVMGSFRA